MNSKSFHQLCNSKGETIILYENNQGNIFGGYSSISWENTGSYKNAPNSFIFTLTNIYNTKPTKFHSNNLGNEICNNIAFGPCFGYGKDIGVFVNSGNYSKFPTTNQDNLGKGKSIFTGNKNNNKEDFILKEIEVYHLFK